jgi:hypothetical protein
MAVAVARSPAPMRYGYIGEHLACAQPDLVFPACAHLLLCLFPRPSIWWTSAMTDKSPPELPESMNADCAVFSDIDPDKYVLNYSRAEPSSHV